MTDPGTPKLIKELRERLGLTQEQFAQRVGVTFNSVNHWENGKRTPHPFLARRLVEMKEELAAEQAAAVAASVVASAQPLCFPNWQMKTNRKQEIFLAITKALVQQHRVANLHPPATGFLDRAIRRLEKTRYVGTIEPDATS